MQKKDITLTFEDEKLDALEFSLKKKGSSVQRRMQEALKNLYEQEVAAPVREYLDSKSAPAAKPRRPVQTAGGRGFLCHCAACRSSGKGW